ncbi:MAG: hypothetical protein SFV20_01570 [Sphingopyxis sp.]|nr:hypothetical protein [Sphingopyxis sp.]
MRRLSALLAAATAFSAPAQAAPRQISGWAMLARQDVVAAHRLLLANHPGFVPGVGDVGLRQRERAAYRLALRRIARVRSLGGYRAVLDRYLTAMHDAHIAAYPLARPLRVSWPGFLVTTRGDRWTVTQSAGGSAPADGAEWLGCDGRTAEAIAADRVGSVLPWSLPAHRRTNAAQLMIDRGDPFVTPLRQCRFAEAGDVRSITLAWRPLATAELNALTARAAGLAGARFDVRTAPDGALWIGYGEMSDRVQPVLAALDGAPAQLARAPYVVVDVRGNGGGDSRVGDALVQRLFPNSPTTVPTDDPGFQSWRASPGNAAALRQSARDSAADAAWLLPLASEMDRAVAAHRAFVTPLPPRPWPQPRAAAPSGDPSTARILLLTDPTCFSSCLVLVDQLRRLGAAQIGLPTDGSTPYLSGRFVELPSGLSRMIVMQVLGVGGDRLAQPFAPAATFAGDMRNDDQLMAWVAGLRRATQGGSR